MTDANGLSSERGGRPVDLLLTHGRVITMDEQRRILRDGAIAIDQGRIVAVGPAHEVSPSVRARERRDLKGAMVHPGYVDAHVHPTLQLVRGVLPDYYDEATLYKEYSAPSAAERTEDEEYYSTLLASMEMAHNGTTAFADTGSFAYLDRCVSAVNKVGIRGAVGGPGAKDRQEIPGWFRIEQNAPSAQDQLKRLEDQISRFPRNGARVWCAVTLLGLGTASEELLRGAKELADERGVQLIMHRSWSNDEVEDSLAQTGLRPIEHLSKLGMLGPNLTLVHMIHVDEREVDLLAESGTSVVHCPAAGIKRAYGAARHAKFPEMLSKGVPVSLGCDAANWSNSLDIGRMAYLACLIHREVRGVVPTISAETALEMATLHGAKALGLGDEIGSLEVGKRADIVIHTTKAPEVHPAHDLVNNLVYSSLSETVESVLVDGSWVLQEGELVNLDAAEEYERIDAAAKTLCDRVGFPLPQHWPVI